MTVFCITFEGPREMIRPYEPALSSGTNHVREDIRLDAKTRETGDAQADASLVVLESRGSFDVHHRRESSCCEMLTL